MLIFTLFFSESEQSEQSEQSVQSVQSEQSGQSEQSVQSELRLLALLTDAFGGLLQPLTQMPYSTSTYTYPLPSICSPIHYSLIIVCTCILSVSQCRITLNK
jgi:hypothetical protein